MTNEEEIERMLESGNPQIFTEGVSFFVFVVVVVVYFCLLIISLFVCCQYRIIDIDRNETGEGALGRNRSPPQGHSQTRAEHQGAT